MYIRYQIGNPSIKTESVVQKLEVTDGKMPGWGYNRQVAVHFAMHEFNLYFFSILIFWSNPVRLKTSYTSSETFTILKPSLPAIFL